MGLVAYITAGDPSLEATEKIVLAAAEAGADVIELGVPFSDPVADGPTIQRASERALRGGTTLAGVIELVRRVRANSDVPLVLFSYFNPILQMGLEKFAGAAAAAGADGVLATDLTPEEAGEYRTAMRAHGLDTIFLAAPTSTDARLAKIAGVSSGFLYLISRTGVTGARERLARGIAGAGAPRAAIHEAAARGRIRHFAAGARIRAGRNRRCGRRGLGAGGGNREIGRARMTQPPRVAAQNPHPERRGARRREPPNHRSKVETCGGASASRAAAKL